MSETIEKESANHEEQHLLDADLEAMLQTDIALGLSDAQVEERLAKWGRNGIFSI